jgi:hypothetical protein
VLTALLVSLAAGIFTTQKLEYKTNRNDLIGRDTAYWRLYHEYVDEFRSEEDYLVMVESDNPARNREAVDHLRSALLAKDNNPHPTDSGYAQQFMPPDVFARVNFDAIRPWFLYYLSNKELHQIRDSVHEFRRLVSLLEANPTLVTFYDAMDQMLQQMAAASPSERERMTEFLPTITLIVNQMSNITAPHNDAGLLSPWAGAFFSDEMIREANEQMQWQGYHVFEAGQIFVTLIHPRERTTEQTRPHHHETIEKIRRIIREVRPLFPDVTINLTGEPVLDHDETAVSKRDARRATLVTMLLCGLLFIFGFREWLRPLLALACIALTVIISLGAATLWPGHLNIITVTFAVMIIGLGIDLTIQFIARYEECLSRGISRIQAVRTAISQTGPSILTAGITNAAAFFAMTLSGFRGTIELGVIAGIGLLVATAVALLVMPPFLLLVHRRRESTHIPARAAATQLELWLLRRPYLILAVCIAGTGLAGLFCWQVRFDYNVLNLQSHGLESVDAELRLLLTDAQSTIYASVIADSLEEARTLHERLAQLPTVGSVASIVPLIPEDQDANRDTIRAIKAELADVRLTAPGANPVNVGELLKTLGVLRLRAARLSDTFAANNNPDAARALRSLAESVAKARSNIQSADPAAATPATPRARSGRP